LLCSGFTQFLLKHDRQGVLRFASMQGTTGRQLLAQAGVDPDDVDTVLFVRNGHAWCESAAVLRILHVLGWPWRLAWVGWLVPVPLRDALYR
ncbi:thiol-disulfide oxidoreductase DCC family protein, partial [Vibrio owensii]|uniref:thiol-disulfide oxidoreductase DCC family protein n=2 Tax=Pseudomonadota TaxID=1224 RepID=UPI0040681E2C